MIRVGEGGRYRCESGVDTGERLGKMQVRGGRRIRVGDGGDDEWTTGEDAGVRSLKR